MTEPPPEILALPYDTLILDAQRIQWCKDREIDGLYRDVIAFLRTLRNGQIPLDLWQDLASYERNPHPDREVLAAILTLVRYRLTMVCEGREPQRRPTRASPSRRVTLPDIQTSHGPSGTGAGF